MFTQLKTRVLRSVSALTAAALLSGTGFIAVAAPAVADEATAPVESTENPSFPSIAEPTGETLKYVNWNINEQFWSHFLPAFYAPDSRIETTGGVIKNDDKTFSLPVLSTTTVDGVSEVELNGAMRGTFNVASNGGDQYFVQFSDLKVTYNAADAASGVVTADVTSGQYVATGEIPVGSTFADDVAVGTFTLPTSRNAVQAPWTGPNVTTVAQEFTGLDAALRSSVRGHFKASGASSDARKPMGALKFETRNLPAFPTIAEPSTSHGKYLSWNINQQFWSHFSPAFYAPNSRIEVTGGVLKNGSTFAFPYASESVNGTEVRYELNGAVRGTFNVGGDQYFVQLSDIEAVVDSSLAVQGKLYATVTSGQYVSTGGVDVSYLVEQDVEVGTFSIPATSVGGSSIWTPEGTISESQTFTGIADAVLSTMAAHFKATGASSDSRKPMGAVKFELKAGLVPLELVQSGGFTTGSIQTAHPISAAPGVGFTYQWLRDGAAITDATEETYVLSAADVDKTVSVKVTANAVGYYDQTKTSAGVSAVIGAELEPTVAPAINGTPKFNQVLTVTDGVWPLTGTKVSYQWLRNGVVIEDATAAKYTVALEDLGQKITVVVTAVLDGYTTGSVETAEVVGDKASAPTNSKKAWISGTAKFNSTLTANAGAWNNAASSFKYQWLRDGKAISGATKATYKLTSADIAKKISVKVTAVKDGYADGSSTSNAVTVAKADAAKATKAPVISGTKRFNSTLKVNAGSWNNSGLAYKYQWLRDGKSISGATKSSYKLTSKDVAKRISVKVTAVKTGHTDGSVTTARTSKIAKVTPSVSTKLSKTSIKRKQSTKITVTIKASGVSKPVGKVTVKVGKKTFTKTVKSSHKGKVTITLKNLKVGKKQKVTAKFTPSSSSKTVLNSKTSSTKRLTVR